MKSYEYNIFDAWNALQSFKQCYEQFERERRQARELCEAGLLDLPVYEKAANSVIDELKSALELMQARNFVAAMNYLTPRDREFKMHGMTMHRLCPPLSLFQAIQDIKNSELSRGFRFNGPRLRESWISSGIGARLTFERFKTEMQRYGYLHSGTLHLTGKEIRSLYRFLVKEQIIEPLPSMIAVFDAFKADFKLKVKSASSLQRIKDDDEEIDSWKNVFFMTEIR